MSQPARPPFFFRSLGIFLAALLPALAAGAVLAAEADPPSASAARADDRAELLRRIDKLEKELQQLRQDTRTLEVSEQERAKAKPVAGYDKGFFLQSPDGKTFKLRVGGYTQFDGRVYLSDSPPSNPDQFSLRRARLDLRGTVGERFDFRLVPDFAGSTLVLQDAYVDTRVWPSLVIRTGKFKTPFGLEHLQPSTVLLFTERSLVDNLVPNRDLGVQIGGVFREGLVAYQVGIFNGVPDGSSGDADVNDPFDFAARLFAQPFLATSWAGLKGLGLGAAATYGQEQGSASSTQLSTYKTSSRATFFRYVSNSPATAAGTTVADGDHYRLSPQGYYYYGPLGVMGEYVLSSQDLTQGAVKGRASTDAWQLRSSYVLTGEAAAYTGVVPAHNFDFGGGGWGAWELGVRYAELDVDDEVFNRGFADPTVSASRASAVTGGLNWYVNPNVLVYLDYEHTWFRKGANSGDRRAEDALLTRLQLVF